MSRYKDTGIVVDDSEVGRIWTFQSGYCGPCINIDIHQESHSIFFTKDELRAMIAAIEAVDAARNADEIARD